MFCGHQRILLSRETYEKYLHDCEVVNDKLVLIENRNSSFIQPTQRLFVYKCFSIEGFAKLCKAYRTSLFQCYSRLLPFNTDLYCADFGLLDYELYSRTIGSERELNDYEKKVFKINTYFHVPNTQNFQTTMFVTTLNEFQEHLATRFLSAQWLEAIDFSKFAIVGGCVINALCQSPFPDTDKQDINLIYLAYDGTDFEIAVMNVVTKLQTMTLNHLKHEINVEKLPGLLHYDVFLSCGVKLNFLYTPIQYSKNRLSHILHNFDIDICQVAFTGSRIVSTFAFLQALATRSFIAYSLHAETPKNVCTRIAKYCERGFTLLEPIHFDGDFDVLMKQDNILLYRVEQRDFIDEDGEVQIETTEYWRQPERNIDTFQLQEAFMAII